MAVKKAKKKAAVAKSAASRKKLRARTKAVPKKVAKKAARKVARKTAKAVKKLAGKAKKVASAAKSRAARAKARPAKKKDGRPPAGNWPALAPYLTVRDGSASLDFYRDAFGFEIEGMVMRDAEGRVMHAGMRLGDACIMFAPQGMSDAMQAPVASGAPDSLSLYVYVPDVDAHAERAQDAGAAMLQGPADQFWGDRISTELNQQLEQLNSEMLLNLASQEYFKAVDKKALKAKVLNVEFKDFKNGQYKIISFFAKKARGLMARYVIKERLTNPEGLKDFNYQGYRYSAEHSKADSLVFLRDQPQD